MRIIGGNDYYDNAMGYGIDTTIVFVRKPLIKADVVKYKNAQLTTTRIGGISFKNGGLKAYSPYRTKSEFATKGAFYSGSAITIYFGGKRYNGIKIHVSHNDGRAISREEICFWDHDSFKKFLNEIGADLSDNAYQDYETQYLTSKNVKNYFSEKEKKSDLDWLIENKISIAIDKGYAWEGESFFDKSQEGWKINCDGLSDYQFYKAVNPFEAFQHLEQYITGVLPQTESNIVKITNEKVILAKHGMDNMSFKKTPTKKRR